MKDITLLIDKMESGNEQAAELLLPMVYDELRKLAAARLYGDQADCVLQPTVLVHEAYIRLVHVDHPQKWSGRGHFFAAAAEAMRRIVIEYARHNKRLKRGGNLMRVDLEMDQILTSAPTDLTDLLALDDAISALEQHDQMAANLVKLRYFGGLQMKEAREVLGLSRGQADRLYLLAKTWLYRHLRYDDLDASMKEDST